MIQTFTRLVVADNSGAKEIMCINIPGSSRRRAAGASSSARYCRVRAKSDCTNTSPARSPFVSFTRDSRFAIP